VLTFCQVVVKRVRGGAGSCRTADQFQVLQNAGALAIVVVDDVQERLSFRWFVFPDPSSVVAPLLLTICAGTKAPQVEAFARGPPAP
jgi:hypothetical protein